LDVCRKEAALIEIQVERIQSATDEVRALIRKLDDELGENYPPEQQHGLKIDAIFEPHVRFFLARKDGVALGCGGVAFFPGFAEVKRMYVAKEARGQGIADAIVAKLEDEAANANLSILRLETGTLQIAALRFYERLGFHPCEAFEPYSSMPPNTIATSVFLEKRLPEVL